jgi:hypothetical protein
VLDRNGINTPTFNLINGSRIDARRRFTRREIVRLLARGGDPKVGQIRARRIGQGAFGGTQAVCDFCFSWMSALRQGTARRAAGEIKQPSLVVRMRHTDVRVSRVCITSRWSRPPEWGLTQGVQSRIGWKASPGLIRGGYSTLRYTFLEFESYANDLGAPD